MQKMRRLWSKRELVESGSEIQCWQQTKRSSEEVAGRVNGLGDRDKVAFVRLFVLRVYGQSRQEGERALGRGLSSF